MTFQDPLVQNITHFLESIGIAVHAATIDEPAFVAGMRYDRIAPANSDILTSTRNWAGKCKFN